MSSFISAIVGIWQLCFAWMPPALAALCLVIIGIVAIFLIVRLIGIILEAIPFL